MKVKWLIEKSKKEQLENDVKSHHNSNTTFPGFLKPYKNENLIILIEHINGICSV